MTTAEVLQRHRAVLRGMARLLEQTSPAIAKELRRQGCGLDVPTPGEEDAIADLAMAARDEREEEA